MGARVLGISLLAAAALAVAAGAVLAQPAPGTIVNKTNAAEVKDFVSPGVMWCLERGMTMKVIPYKKIEWNPPYKEATEKYSGQAKLAADGRSVETREQAFRAVPYNVWSNRGEDRMTVWIPRRVELDFEAP